METMRNLQISVPEEMYLRFKVSCVRGKTTMREVITRMIETHLRWEDHVPTAPAASSGEVQASEMEPLI